MADYLAEFFAMGGYAFYVWGSYGIVAAVLIQQYAAPVIRRRRLLRELAKLAESGAGDSPAADAADAADAETAAAAKS